MKTLESTMRSETGTVETGLETETEMIVGQDHLENHLEGHEINLGQG